jgi:hypothetical protein
MSVHETCTKPLRQRSRNGRNSRDDDLTGRIPFMATKKKAVKKKAPAVDVHKLKQWSKRGEGFKTAEFRLRETEFRHQWAIADWMLDGEESFGKTKAGKTKAYDEAEKITGFTRGTLEQFAHTAKKVSLLTRVKGLSFGHHRLVAQYIPEKQARYLKHAKDNKETVASFAAYLKTLKQDADDKREAASPADVAAANLIEACDSLLRKCQSALSKHPSLAVRTDVLDRLKKAVAELNEKVEQIEQSWHVKTRGAGAGR